MKATDKEIEIWSKEANDNDINYIIIVHNKIDDNDYPIYCKDFCLLHKMYHELLNNNENVNELIRIYNDGSIERNLILTNLL